MKMILGNPCEGSFDPLIESRCLKELLAWKVSKT